MLFPPLELPFSPFNVPHYKFHQSSCDDLLNFCDAQCQYRLWLLITGSLSSWYDVFNGIFVRQFMTTAFAQQCSTNTLRWWPRLGGRKIFRFIYVLHSRELNFSLCHMVCPSARDTQANEEARKYPSRERGQKASLGSSLSVISSLERRRILDGPCVSNLTILLGKQCVPWVWRKLATSSLAGLQSWLKVTAAAQRHRVTVQINRAILKA